jgi:hypothetical protein
VKIWPAHEMRIEDLLAILSQKHREQFDAPPNKTKLIKLAYLAEVYFKSNTGNRLTDAEWIYWLYGPYIRTYDSLILNESIFVAAGVKNEFVPVEVSSEYEMEETSLDENTAILSALKHGSDSLADILNFVYFDTEPMVAATKRGQPLDFETVLSFAEYVVKDYRISKTNGNNILQKILNWEVKRHNVS